MMDNKNESLEQVTADRDRLQTCLDQILFNLGFLYGHTAADEGCTDSEGALEAATEAAQLPGQVLGGFVLGENARGYFRSGFERAYQTRVEAARKLRQGLGAALIAAGKELGATEEEAAAMRAEVEAADAAAARMAGAFAQGGRPVAKA